MSNVIIINHSKSRDVLLNHDFHALGLLHYYKNKIMFLYGPSCMNSWSDDRQ